MSEKLLTWKYYKNLLKHKMNFLYNTCICPGSYPGQVNKSYPLVLNEMEKKYNFMLNNFALIDIWSVIIISEAIVKGFQACDDETVKDYIQKADELITKVKKDKDELIDKEVAGDGDEDLPKTKTGRLPLNGSIPTKVVCRAVEIPCPTCPTWSHFIQDKLKISIYLSLDKCKICY